MNEWMGKCKNEWRGRGNELKKNKAGREGRKWQQDNEGGFEEIHRPVLLASLAASDLGVEKMTCLRNYWQIPVTTRSKAWVCCRLLAGIVGSNPVGGMDVCLLWVLCVVR
jgi:hypothetical protein